MKDEQNSFCNFECRSEGESGIENLYVVLKGKKIKSTRLSLKIDCSEGTARENLPKSN